MENNNLKNDSLPFGKAKLVLGISSIILSFMSLFAIIGFIIGVIAVYLVDKDKQMLKQFPDNYSDAAAKKHKTGTILAWIGFILSTLSAIAVLYMYGVYGTLDLTQIREMQ
ncbi:MAG: CCC motif membrane protein [Bacteroidota bacterium]|nr:CCC motif membrane protein [Bacteroidota bacterium]